ncbi:ATP-binding protein [Escherichia coli]|nr:ATP-binding protein [Escherichia coli]EMB7054261.1 AAA family ATPase [Escherichia coli]
MSKMLYIVRGLPGSGKSTLAKELSLDGSYPHFENDMFWYDNDGNYNWDASKVSLAAKWCKESVEDSMKYGYDRIVVSNTFTKEKHVNEYVNMAKKYGYNYTTIVVENRHGSSSIHNVPDHVIDRMERELKNCIKLK